MTTIKQNGFDFTYIHKIQGKQPDIQTWSIERVASFMFLVEFHRRNSQRYQKGFTRVSRYGAIQYELEDVDNKTYKDLDNMTKRLSLLFLSESKTEELWLSPFDKGLDWLEEELKNYIKKALEPVSIFGKEVIMNTEFIRPTKEEYEALMAEKRAKEEEEARALAEKRVKTAVSGVVPVTVNQTIKFNFIKHGVLECKVVGIVGRSYICEVYKNGECIDNACKIGMSSKRIVG